MIFGEKEKYFYMCMEPRKRTQQPAPGFLPTQSYGQRSLAGYSPWGRQELDMTEQLSPAQRTQHRLVDGL